MDALVCGALVPVIVEGLRGAKKRHDGEKCKSNYNGTALVSLPQTPLSVGQFFEHHMGKAPDCVRICRLTVKAGMGKTQGKMLLVPYCNGAAGSLTYQIKQAQEPNKTSIQQINSQSGRLFLCILKYPDGSCAPDLCFLLPHRGGGFAR